MQAFQMYKTNLKITLHQLARNMTTDQRTRTTCLFVSRMSLGDTNIMIHKTRHVDKSNLEITFTSNLVFGLCGIFKSNLKITFFHTCCCFVRRTLQLQWSTPIDTYCFCCGHHVAEYKHFKCTKLILRLLCTDSLKV
jgi:hypothetical protein